MSNEIRNIPQTEIVLYQPNESTRLEVRLEDETVWLTQAQMITLFDSSKANISEHISNIYKQGELMPESTVRKFRTVRIDDSLYHRVYPEHRRRSHSLNAVGNKMSAITLMGIHPDVILSEIR